MLNATACKNEEVVTRGFTHNLQLHYKTISTIINIFFLL